MKRKDESTMKDGRVNVAFDKQGESVHYAGDKDRERQKVESSPPTVKDGDVTFKTTNEGFQSPPNNQAKATSRPMTNFPIRSLNGEWPRKSSRCLLADK